MELDNIIIFAFLDTFNLKVQKKKVGGVGVVTEIGWMVGYTAASLSVCTKPKIMFRHISAVSIVCDFLIFIVVLINNYRHGLGNHFNSNKDPSLHTSRYKINPFLNRFFPMSQGTTMQKVKKKKKRKKMQNQIILLNKKIINVLSLTFR